MINLLFLCTGNSARSVLGEALVNHIGAEQFRGFSAGSDPAGKVQPLALDVLETIGIDTTGLRSKSWNEFTSNNDHIMHIVLTLCADAASKPCPVWLDSGVLCHWGLPDPAAVTGNEQVRRKAFELTLEKLKRRLSQLIALDQSLFLNTSQVQLKNALLTIHQQALNHE